MVAALVTIMGEEKASEYLKKLNPSIQTYTQSGTARYARVEVADAHGGRAWTNPIWP